MVSRLEVTGAGSFLIFASISFDDAISAIVLSVDGHVWTCGRSAAIESFDSCLRMVTSFKFSVDGSGIDKVFSVVDSTNCRLDGTNLSESSS